MKAKNILIGLLVIIAWLPLILRLYVTFPVFINEGIDNELVKMESSLREVVVATYGSVENYASEQKQKNWNMWAITLLVFAFGMTSGFLARGGKKGWKPSVMVMSSIFIVAYLFELFQVTGGVFSIAAIIDIKIALAKAILKSQGQVGQLAFILTEALFLAAFIVHCIVIALTSADLRSTGLVGKQSGPE